MRSAATTHSAARCLGHWTFDLSRISSTQVLDSSGNGHHGAIVGTPPPLLISGRIGEAMDFGTTTQAYFDFPSVPLDATPGGFTSVSMWFFETNPNPDEALVYLPEAPSADPPRYDLWLVSNVGGPTLCVNGGEGECWGISNADGANLTGRWVAVFFNGLATGSLLYVDGAQVNATCQFGICNQSRVAMGPFRIGGSDTMFPYKRHDRRGPRLQPRAYTGRGRPALRLRTVTTCCG